MISQVGEGLSKKQAVWASAIVSILLGAFLMLGNFVLLKNSASFSSEMPFLSIVKDSKLVFALAYVVILVGCWTTLVSLTLTLKTSFVRCVKSDWTSAVLAVLLPFAASMIGFAEIVSFFYPICSVLGIFVLGYFLCDARKKTS